MSTTETTRTDTELTALGLVLDQYDLLHADYFLVPKIKRGSVSDIGIVLPVMPDGEGGGVEYDALQVLTIAAAMLLDKIAQTVDPDWSHAVVATREAVTISTHEASIARRRAKLLLHQLKSAEKRGNPKVIAALKKSIAEAEEKS